MNNRDIIRAREAPMTLDRSEDFTKRVQFDSIYRGNPLAHTSAILEKGLQGKFVTPAPRIDWGR